MSRLAGRFLQIRIDDFSLGMSKVDPKAMAMEQLVRHMERDCPKCVGCREAKLHEQKDHMRMAMLLGVSCKQNVRNNGDMVRCPDGFYGIYDATAKEVKEVRLEMPTAAFGIKTLDPRDAFVREYMVDHAPAENINMRTELTQRMIEKRVMSSLEENSFGVKKIAVGLDTLLKPAVAIPTDRTSYPPVKPVNKDVPATADGDAW